MNMVRILMCGAGAVFLIAAFLASVIYQGMAQQDDLMDFEEDEPE